MRTVLMIWLGSLVSTMIGMPSTPPRYLYSRALPSMTGKPAFGPMSPSPNTRVPSLTTATVFHLLVYSYTNSGSAAMALHGAATPGRSEEHTSELQSRLHLLFPL